MRKFFYVTELHDALGNTGELTDLWNELRRVGIPLHGADGDLVSASGLRKFATINYPQGGYARSSFLDRVYEGRKK